LIEQKQSNSPHKLKGLTNNFVQEQKNRNEDQEAKEAAKETKPQEEVIVFSDNHNLSPY
jgi:serine/threonine protein kinase